MRWVAAEIAEIVGGDVTRGDPHAAVERITQDSRKVDPEIPTLLVPLHAERDGHDFVAGSGATVALSDRPAPHLGIGRDLEPDMTVIEVHDTAIALRALASAGRLRLNGRPVVGITGSVGKTTTKDLLAAVLAADRPTHASHRSFNNEIGLPLTVLNAPDDTEALILEMGARGIGHIKDLCAVGRPTVGIVTAVGAAHTSEFGSVEGVAQAKGELVEALPAAAAGGTAVLSASQPLVAAMADRTDAEVVTFGDGGTVHATDVQLDDELVPRFTLQSPWGSGPVVLGARGVHLVDNALAAAAAALAIGVPLDTVVAGLAAPSLSPMRMSLVRSARGTRIIDDTYNANPMSTEAALRSLSALPVSGGGQRIAVLGVMAELGDVSATEHARIGSAAAAAGIRVIAVNAPDYLADVGEDSHALASDIPEALRLLANPATGSAIGPDDVLLIKGSRVAGLERVVELLVE
ncbi:MAG: UDP-N-acetylmuramoyl-tripeptide--D-alanyl-D-alanine ligase [Acidimicrobiales bacterium]|jgi:UDP-N-acetylmuramoyl-tripeptide--D-alanyl-D-alanine ligase|nr:UDP-N-acetylmuramoyl-tripeptide--D-alanyl-D-alanine ligase [Acidimicrobiales bacterium]